jgi:plasmid stabilization system protein ParE
MRVNRRRQARRDVLDIFLYIGFRSPQAGDRFLLPVERTLNEIARQPGLGTPFLSDDPRLVDLRVRPVESIKSHLIFPRMTDEEIDVIRVFRSACGDIK